jgi:hypothetical protein
MVYDVRRDYKLVKYLKCKQSVRSICQFSKGILIVGQNEGWIELISLSKLDQIDIISSKRFDKLGHIFQIQTTAQSNVALICSYTGVHFLNVKCDPKSFFFSVTLSELSYETE